MPHDHHDHENHKHEHHHHDGKPCSGHHHEHEESAGHHHHHHSHQVTSINNSFIAGVSLNIIFVVIEAFYGFKSNSLALLADAAHNLGDVLGLLVAWFGFWLAQRHAPHNFTYGYKNATIIAAFINALLLFSAVGGIGWEAVQRFGHLSDINSTTVMAVAAVGVFINGLTAMFFYRGGHDDVNIRGAFLHMFYDALVSVGVIIGGALILWKSWFWIDPVISLAIAAVVLAGSWSLFKETLNLLMLGVPASIDIAKFEKLMKEYKGLIGYHDLHIWPMGTSEVALSAHIAVEPQSFSEEFAQGIEKVIKDNFPISHVTLQMELEGRACETDCCKHE